MALTIASTVVDTMTRIVAGPRSALRSSLSRVSARTAAPASTRSTRLWPASSPASSRVFVLAASLSALVAIGTGSVARRAEAQSPRVMDTRPTIAVLYFDNGALVDNAKYEPLRKGMSTMLGFELARNPAIRVVERDKLQALLNEQNLQNSDRVDQATAVRLGKLLGVRHFIDGGFVIDGSKKVRIDVRAINTETGQWEYTETISGKSDQMLDLVGQLGAKINKGMKLPEIPIVKGASPGSSMSRGPNQERITQLLSRAEEEMDRGNAKYAAQLYRNVLELNKNYDLAQSRLASIERMAK